MDASEIVKNAGDISLEGAAVGTPKFCELWPAGKKALLALLEVIKNPIAKASVSIVIAAGDAVFGKMC